MRAYLNVVRVNARQREAITGGMQMSNEYWANRMARNQQKISDKSIKQIEKQMAKYYSQVAQRVIKDFEATYNKILLQQAEGKEITPALLYQLDSYWQMQAQTRRELERLGEKQIALLTREFEANFFEVYYSIDIEGDTAFNTIDKTLVRQMIESSWVNDGKSFSQRIWKNTEDLVRTLNEGLIHCVATGKKTSELKNILQERFGVSYSNADMLVRTEMAHIQTQAAKKRYEDAGVLEVEVWAPKDERQCEVCGQLHQKRYPVAGAMPVPCHPRCRCCVIPVVEIE